MPITSAAGPDQSQNKNLHPGLTHKLQHPQLPGRTSASFTGALAENQGAEI